VLQAVGDGFQRHQFPQAVGGNRDVRDLTRNGSAVTDCNADTGGRQGRGVVDAVPQHDDGAACGLFGIDKAGLILGQDLGIVGIHANLLCDDGGRAVVVAGHHDRLLYAKAAQLAKHLGGLLTQGVGNADDAGQHPANGKIQVRILRRQGVKFGGLSGRNVAALILKDKVLAADDGLLAADGAGNAVRYDILHLAVHLIMADALCGSGLHNGVRHRVGVMLLQTGGNAKDLVLCAGAERNDLHNGRGGMGQRAGLVKNDGVGVGQCLKILAALDCDVVAAALPHCGQHRQRHRELQRTGEVYHQNRDSARCVAGKRIGDGSAQQAVGHQLIGQRCGAGLTGGFQLFRVLNHPDDLVIAAAASLLFNGQGDLALLHNGACIDNSTGRLAHRLGLAGQRGLIDAGLTVQHPAIQRNHAAGMHDDGIPADGFQLSSGYCAVETAEGIKRCTFTWNNKRFKDPADWFAQMEKRGIVVSPNIKPGMLLVHPLLDEMKEKGMFLPASDDNAGLDGLAVGTWWGGPGLFVDYTKESTRLHWKQYIKDALLKYGCRSIWNDNCEYDSLVDKDAKVYFEGKGSTIGTMKPVMSNLMCQLSNEAIEEYDPDCRPFSVCRSGHAGIQRYAQVWAGDNLTCWDTLKYNIATILGMALCGVSNHGCDIGGFFGPAPEGELFVRWVQNGIFQPRFSIHSTNTDNTVTEPWMYSDKKQYIKDAIDFRYKLSPTLYSLMERAHENGLPIWQPTFAVFQNDPATYDEGVDFMFGDSLLVANVVEKGQTVRPVYLPKTENENERFYDFYTREEYAPGQTVEVPVNIASIPLFVRSGAIIPMSGNALHNLMTEKTTALDILMAPDVDSAFTLYEDDGRTNDYRNGAYLKTKIAVKAGVKTVVSFTNEGSYETAVESVALDMIHREKSPFYVQLDGKELPHFLHRRKFEQAESGWYYSQRLKSVQIKYPNPKHDHEVLVSFEQFDLIGM
jgi:hypothetical protein